MRGRHRLLPSGQRCCVLGHSRPTELSQQTFTIPRGRGSHPYHEDLGWPCNVQGHRRRFRWLRHQWLWLEPSRAFPTCQSGPGQRGSEARLCGGCPQGHLCGLSARPGLLLTLWLLAVRCPPRSAESEEQGRSTRNSSDLCHLHSAKAVTRPLESCCKVWPPRLKGRRLVGSVLTPPKPCGRKLRS